MNRRLSEFQIRSTCRALLKGGRVISGRQLRRELNERFGAVGKTDRVFQIWREEARTAAQAAALNALPTDVAELQRRLRSAETESAANLKRAELAEYREQAHQDYWAVEIDKLRQELQTLRESQEGQGASRPFPV
jgi:DNA repair exonuclease SbcCD ATPase subunit